MTSQIDPTLPVTGTPTTASVRANFQTAHDEITALQAAAGAITASEVAITPAIGTLGPNVQTGLAYLNTNTAPINSPPLTGNPTAPTPAPGDNDASIATTAFVHAAVAPAFNDTGRNKIHNPLFSIAQRGPGPFTASGIYALDRWCTYIATDTASFLQYAATDTDRSQIGDEAANLFLTNTFTGNAAAAACNIIFQRIEGARRLANRTVTVSFYAQASTTQKLGVSVDQNMGTGGTPSADVLGNGQAVQLSAGWARYSLPFVLPSLAGKTLGTAGNDYTTLNFWYSSGATNATRSGNVGVQSGIINIWGVQVEIGSVATPLEKPDRDLANCQRFFQTGALQVYGYGFAANAPLSSMLGLPVSMRASPTVVTPTWTTQTNTTAPALAVLSASALLASVQAAAAGSVNLAGSFTASADL